MTKKKTASAAYSAGARYERAAFLKHLRTRLKTGDVSMARVSTILIAWVRDRQKRYRSRKGGL